ncbi:MAG: hypothetical protein MJZ97_05915, partial [Bacteroidales bacterium]|nr:hypothetical protein [Bacteroidales bacterium]
KTQLLDNLSVTWCEGDGIKVFSNTDSRGKIFSAASAGTIADFDPVEAVTDAFYTPPYTAFYPESAVRGTNQIYLDGTQHYTMTDDVLTFAVGENPMATQSNSKELPFRNLCGILKFQLYSTTPCTVKSLCVASLKAGEQLWGSGTVTFDGTDATLGALTDGGASITLDCGDGVTLSTDASHPTDFFVVIPGGALSEGFKVTVTDTDGKVWSRTATAGNTITKSKIKAMPKLEAPVTPSTVTLTASCSSENIFNIGGSVTVPTGTYTCEFGLVYSDSDDTPTIEEGAQKVEAGTATFSGIMEFTADITGLTVGTTYHVRAYAKIDGTAYSTAKDIVGGNPMQPLPSSWTNGENPYPFTVGEGKVVHFSQGNLQYLAKGGSGGNASPTAASGTNVGGTWRFAEHQFDFVGDATLGNVYEGDVKCNNAEAAQAQDYDGWIDLFGWGTSGYNHGGTCYQPWSTSTTHSQYYAYSTSSYTYNLEGGPDPHTGMADWGKANAIINGVGISWRTLTKDEWAYLINRKDGSNKLLYGEGKVGSCTPGLIILPDNWSCPSGLTDVERGGLSWSNVYSYSEWAQMEAAGAVFLPAAGNRSGTLVQSLGFVGYYWSSSFCDDKFAHYLLFSPALVRPFQNDRFLGSCVRLVRDVAPN